MTCKLRDQGQISAHFCLSYSNTQWGVVERINTNKLDESNLRWICMGRTFSGSMSLRRVGILGLFVSVQVLWCNIIIFGFKDIRHGLVDSECLMSSFWLWTCSQPPLMSISILVLNLENNTLSIWFWTNAGTKYSKLDLITSRTELPAILYLPY